MPHPPDVQPDLPDPPSSDADGQPFDNQPNNIQPDIQLLDASSLSTVLDMLAVIDSTEDLALLELLTSLQKRQVWDATPEIIRLRLKQIRLTANSSPEASENSALETPEAQAQIHESPLPISSTFQKGDRVILLAKPQLTATEMNVIWKVVRVEADQVYVEASGLSDRQYPLAWIVRYPN